MSKRKPIQLQDIFRGVAKDIENYVTQGYTHALAIDDPDAMQEALEIATYRHNLRNPDILFSTPDLERDQTGYIVVKDEEIAIDIQAELLSEGFECARAKDGRLQPLPRFF